MAHGLTNEYWDYVVSILLDRGTTDEAQAAEAKNLSGSDKFRYVNDYVSEGSWGGLIMMFLPLCLISWESSRMRMSTETTDTRCSNI